MIYLEEYCKTFNLTVEYNLILNESDEVVGYVEPNKKYVKFNNSDRPIKESDFLLLAIEKLNVHD